MPHHCLELAYASLRLSKSSAVQHAHYNDYRLVADNFASALYSN